MSRTNPQNTRGGIPEKGNWNQPNEWVFDAVGLVNRPIRQEEIFLLCQLLPPSILSLIAYGEPESDVFDKQSTDLGLAN